MPFCSFSWTCIGLCTTLSYQTRLLKPDLPQYFFTWLSLFTVPPLLPTCQTNFPLISEESAASVVFLPLIFPSPFTTMLAHPQSALGFWPENQSLNPHYNYGWPHQDPVLISTASKQPSRQQWEKCKETIIQYYADHSLAELMAFMERTYSFKATYVFSWTLISRLHANTSIVHECTSNDLRNGMFTNTRKLKKGTNPNFHLQWNNSKQNLCRGPPPLTPYHYFPN